MYYIVYSLLWLVSLLPLRVLYIISDGLYGLVFYVFKYRKDVVMGNLARSFPEKTDKERVAIAKQFYHNFIDSFIETIKLLSVSDKYILKRFKGNWEVINQYHTTGRSVQVHLGHNFNWEWGNVAAGKELLFQFLGVYMPISNKIFDRLFRKLRARSGTILLRATRMSEDMLPYRGTQYMLGLVADQNPGVMSRALWFDFLNQKTPFIPGPAKNAIAHDVVVVFGFIHKIKRGRYEVVFSVAEEHPVNSTTEEITRKFVRYLEEVIRTYPDMWLWSHRRWKNAWKEEYTFVE